MSFLIREDKKLIVRQFANVFKTRSQVMMRSVGSCTVRARFCPLRQENGTVERLTTPSKLVQVDNWLVIGEHSG
jgi:hypothetical protein